ncbi:unnamed protein product [Rhizoctonia solani]|uniref:Uncharacterized protein n=1 Tax=Rhizoctonia solani TaxID=456999 RepID=A0A8H2X298_9AGAM|nr:unnamed protein product [Rhizoctonia solani]
MSNTDNAGCAACEARNKKYGRTRKLGDCRHCANAIERGRYMTMNSRIPKPKQKRGDESQTSTHHRRSEHIDGNGFTRGFTGIVTSSIGLPVLGDIPSRSGEDCSVFPTINHLGRFESLDWPTAAPAPWPYNDLHSRATISLGPTTLPVGNGQNHTPISHLPTPPIEGSVSGSGTRRGPSFGPNSQAEPTVNWPVGLDHDIETEGPEHLQVGLLNELALDREAESNIVPFVAHSFASWMNLFLFEPTRIISLARESIVPGHSFRYRNQQKMVLIANTMLAVSESTDYDLAYFVTLHIQLTKGVLEARACRELTRKTAMEAIETFHELLSITCKVGSLENAITLMSLYAPVFRRACPESSEELVNLPRRLTANDLDLKQYVTFDILLSIVTHRPMFFRYDLDFLSPQDEELLNADDGRGLRWMYGVPDRLVVTLARMNTLLEDYGSYVSPEVVQQLETEIGACETVVWSGPGVDPTLNVGRMMVQESWKLAARVYLYMGLCGADSSDARVVVVRNKLMRLLGSVQPRRNPDSFLVVPIVILGVATSSPEDQSALLARLWGVPECNKPGTMGNNMIGMLNDIWARTVGRPAVWSDLRFACLRFAGM